MLYDVFISHAYEDKENFVKPLANELIAKNVEVWYDEYSLSIGDSIRRSIDNGLKESTYGIIVLSKNFFNKNWSQYELDGLLQLQSLSSNKRILPIWHNITKEEIINYSPSLADIYALSSNEDIDNIIEKILEVVKPQGSSLIVARDTLLKYGLKPPVISDDWWLDAAILAGNTTHYDRWCFPIGGYDDSAQGRGSYIAWHVMQREWRNNAEKFAITQITHPEIVLDFINKNPGLKEKCIKHPDFLLAYVPQLAIKGYEGDFIESIENSYQKSLRIQNKYIEKQSTYGSGLTTNGIPPSCDDVLAFRHPSLGFYRPSHLASTFTSGVFMGLCPQFYEQIDYISWLLSSNSNWLPANIKETLLKGYADWATWLWSRFESNSYVDFIENDYTGKLSDAIHKHDKKKFIMTKSVMCDIYTRFEYAKNLLKLEDSTEVLVERFLERDFISKNIERFFTKKGMARKVPIGRR